MSIEGNIARDAFARPSGLNLLRRVRKPRLAAAVAIYFCRRATYFFGESFVRHRSAMAPYLLHFEIMRSARAMDPEWCDLRGVTRENESDLAWQNIRALKRKFVGLELNRVPTLDYVRPCGLPHYPATEGDPDP